MNASSAKDPHHYMAGDYVVCLRDYALQKGIPTQRLLQGTGESVGFLLEPPKQVSESTVNLIGRNIALFIGDDMVAAIEIAKSMTRSNHGILNLAIQNCDTLLDAAKLIHQYAQIRASTRALTLINEENMLCLRYAGHGHQGEKGKYSSQFFSHFSTLMNIAILVVEGISRHDTSGECEIHINNASYPNFPFRLLPKGVTVQFDCEHFQLKVPADWKVLTLRKGDPALAAMAALECEKDLKRLSATDIIEEVNARLSSDDDFNISIGDMAQYLNMSVSTLQRRLAEQNTNFKQVKSRHRLNRGKHLLHHSHHSIDHIAAELGYCDSSNFSKAFKTLTGMTPKVYRKEKKLMGRTK